ncbi:MAG: hypothetical protein IK063_05090 [Clostridia bacterium]|nr:hypothetical protein [Clostridia bacterium]
MTRNSDKPKNKMGLLLKNDFLASSRVISLIYIVEIIAFVFFMIIKDRGNNRMLALGIVLNFAIPFLLIFVSLFFVIYDFNKSLYSQQGYLTYSLPVTAKQLLGSKMIVYGLWMCVSYAVAVFVGGYLASYAEGNENVKMADVALTLFGMPSIAHIKVYLFYYMAMFFVILFSFISAIYFAITASHMRTFQNANFISAVIIFLVCVIIMFIMIAVVDKNIFISFLVYDDGPTKLVIGKKHLTDGVSLPMSPIFYLIVQDIVLFFITSSIMKKWINIK